CCQAHPAAYRAAVRRHHDLLREAWGATGPLRARMGVHLGEAEAYPAPGAAAGRERVAAGTRPTSAAPTPAATAAGSRVGRGRRATRGTGRGG
ncbi:MAG TPA: hypothetical protein VHN78_02340, partial [Chloroflexota bacterium]|nr:hypothetical protein [Chloroflexota bacterium]